MNVLITGAAGGLGYALTEQFLKNGHKVYAGVKDFSHINGLENLNKDSNLTILEIDVSSEKSINEGIKKIKQVDVVINNAGILLDHDLLVTDLSYDQILTTVKVNTLGPMVVNNKLLPLLKMSETPTIVNITSETQKIDAVGSLFPIYTLSKTALAQYSIILKRTLVEQGLENILVFGIHPGRLNTEMGRRFAEIEPQVSAQGIYKIITERLIDNNKMIYINYKGEAMLA